MATRLTPAQKKLVEENLGEARAGVLRYLRRSRDMARFEDDLYQEAVMGLMAAAVRYETHPARTRLAFPFFCRLWVIRTVSDAAYRMRSPVKVHNGGHGMKRMWFDTGPMPEDRAAETPDPVDLLSASVVVDRLRPKLLVRHAARATKTPFAQNKASRDVDIFLRLLLGENADTVAAEAGLKRSTIYGCVLEVQETFERVAEEIRSEAA